MEPWILITLGAAGAQTLRFMLQKHLKSIKLSTGGATFARFIYSAPLLAVIAISYATITGQGAPEVPAQFWPYMLAGGTSQILATMCVVALFAHRNFAVGITFKKTEVLLSALFGFIILGDVFTGWAIFAMCIGLAGVLLLSDPPGGIGPWHQRIFNRATALGLGGIQFGISGHGYRAAPLSQGDGDVVYRAIITLAFVTIFQTLSMAAWLAWRERGQITAVIKAWRIAGLVGLTSMIGSICWFTAFTLQNAAYVFSVWHVELLFSLMFGSFVVGEKVTAREWQGLGLLTCSIIMLVLVT